jgi:hypothetical protein
MFIAVDTGGLRIFANPRHCIEEQSTQVSSVLPFEPFISRFSTFFGAG